MVVRRANLNDIKKLSRFHYLLDLYNYRDLGLKDLFRGADESDLRSFNKVTKEDILDTDNLFYIAEDNNRSLGFAKVKLEKRPTEKSKLYAELDLIFVIQDSQRKGIGKAILDRILSDLKQIGCVGIKCEVFTNNEKSLQFHSKHGFKIVATTHELYKPL